MNGLTETIPAVFRLLMNKEVTLPSFSVTSALPSIMNGGKVLLEHPLSELQANIVKVLVALPDGTELPEGLDILHQSSQGHLYTLIVHGDAAEVTNRLSTAQPQYLDVVPLTLEEIFIYELGGADYAVKDILL